MVRLDSKPLCGGVDRAIWEGAGPAPAPALGVEPPAPIPAPAWLKADGVAGTEVAREAGSLA